MDSSTQIIGTWNTKIVKKTGLKASHPTLTAFRINDLGLELVSRLELEGIENLDALQFLTRLKNENIFITLTGSQLVVTKFEKSTFEKMRFVDLGQGLASKFYFKEIEKQIDAYSWSYDAKLYCYDSIEGIFVKIEYSDDMNKLLKE